MTWRACLGLERRTMRRAGRVTEMNGGETRLGILGGTFNPVHMGHLILAQNALEAHDLAKVLFIPCSTPPHKDASMLLPAEHRLRMLELALEDDPRFDASDIEIRRGGVSYAVDTIAQLSEERPDAQLFFIIGADMLVELHLWRSIYSLLALCHFVTFARPGARVDITGEEAIQLDSPWPERLVRNVRRSRLIEISSSDIRHRVAEGLSIRYLVPPSVERYIEERGLYGAGCAEAGGGTACGGVGRSKL